MISIHAAREGGDRLSRTKRHHIPQFQSTPPVKAATCKAPDSETAKTDFNPRRP